MGGEIKRGMYFFPFLVRVYIYTWNKTWWRLHFETSKFVRYKTLSSIPFATPSHFFIYFSSIAYLCIPNDATRGKEMAAAYPNRPPPRRSSFILFSNWFLSLLSTSKETISISKEEIKQEVVIDISRNRSAFDDPIIDCEEFSTLRKIRAWLTQLLPSPPPSPFPFHAGGGLSAWNEARLGNVLRCGFIDSPPLSFDRAHLSFLSTRGHRAWKFHAGQCVKPAPVIAAVTAH